MLLAIHIPAGGLAIVLTTNDWRLMTVSAHALISLSTTLFGHSSSHASRYRAYRPGRTIVNADGIFLTGITYHSFSGPTYAAM